MKIYFDLDTIFYMIGAASCVIIPCLLLLYAWARYSIVERGKGEHDDR